MMRRASAVAMMVAFATTILAQSDRPAPTSEPSAQAVTRPDAAGAVRKLSKRERKERLSKLDGRYQDFVSDSEPIMLAAEYDTFLMLDTDAQRDSFIDEFWRRRDSANHTTSMSFRDAYYARLEVAKDQFKRVSSERAKMFLLHGAPSEIVRADCLRLLQPIEIWKYQQIPGIGSNLRLLFYKPRAAGDYRLWNPLGGSLAMADLLSNDSLALGGSDESTARRTFNSSASPYSYMNRIQLECKDGDEIMRAITQMVQSRVDLLQLFEPPPINQEEVKKILRSMVIANPSAPKLTADFSVRYPTRSGSRTDVQMMLLVPRAEVTPAEVGGAEVYTIDVTGEVLREGRLWEKYRYRFDYPGNFDGDKLPIVIDRQLRPAGYVSRIKVTDANTGAETVVESPLEVPEVFTLSADEPEVSREFTAAEESVAAVKKEVLDPAVSLLRIIPPAGEIVSGMKTVDTLTSGEAIRAVEFWLDGRKMAVRRSPPYAIDIDFGVVPRPRRIRAIALDAEGKPLTGDDLFVNAGTDPFRVRIESPRIAPRVAGPTRVEMDVMVPDGEELEKLELYWNESRMATLYAPPFIQTIEVPKSQGVGYLRAVATLKSSDVPPAEDLVVINTPAYMEQLNVHLVEMPTTVIIDGKPSSGLTEKEFKVLDAGKPVPLSKFEYVKNLPLSIGIAIDTSGSMEPRMDEAQKAGAQFFESVLRKGDKGFLVSFNSQAQLAQKWSTKIPDLHAALARLRAEETTALYDALIYSLYNFYGIQGQKALVLISDGRDTASKFTFDQAIEYARRSAVPIFTIALGIRGGEMDVRYKLRRLSEETGGSTYFIENARELKRVYDEIENELRSQYILGFYPPPDVKAGGEWRPLEVKVARGKAKTISGYFP